ncbi:MAG: M28 family peptidase [Planctomycetota bacterium]|nr:MAG: M28 family peptidase [Planctomycetota bacterium]
MTTLVGLLLALQQTPAPAFDAADALRTQLAELAGDAYEGRAPGSAGEQRTVDYLSRRMREIGLAPAGADGTWVQSVPLIGIQGKPRLGFRNALDESDVIEPLLPLEAVLSSRITSGPVDVAASDVVFVGYGVVAPEYGWDDYKGVECRGKTLVMLVNDPPVEDAARPGKLDESMFRGRAMTYYGRWTYKYEIASEKGAAACLIVHETGPAGYPYAVVSGSFGRENFDLDDPKAPPRVQAEGWLSEPFARKLLARGGMDFDALKKAAAKRTFNPVSLGVKANIGVVNTVRHVASRNVAGALRGADPKRADEWLVATAHWDHLGRDDALAGDKIYNGAADNASGTAALLTLAEVLARGARPARSVLFVAVTAEEKGLLGSRWYSEHPLVPLEKTLMNLNIDGVNLLGRAADVASVGFGSSTLDEVLVKHAAAQQRTVAGESEPEKGTFYRSDHFHFARMGVPALYLTAPTQFRDRSSEWGKQQRDDYTQNRYHKPSDEVRAEWDYGGAVEDVELLRAVLLDVGAAETWPEWKAGAEFKARREAMLGRAPK